MGIAKPLNTPLEQVHTYCSESAKVRGHTFKAHRQQCATAVFDWSTYWCNHIHAPSSGILEELATARPLGTH